MRVLTMVGAACAAAVIAPVASGTPVLGARAVLSGNVLTLGFARRVSELALDYRANLGWREDGAAYAPKVRAA